MQRRRGSAVAATAPAPRSPPAAAAPWRRIAPAFILTYAAFAVCYLSRANAAAAKRPLAAALSLSDAALGALDALFLAAYALGNFALGGFVDGAPPYRLLAAVLAVNAAASATAALAPLSYGLLGASYVVAGAVQSLLYPACMSALRRAAGGGQNLSALTLAAWTTSAASGSVAGGALARAALQNAGWRAAFAAPVPFTLATAAALLHAMPLPAPAVAPAGAAGKGRAGKGRAWTPLLCAHGVLYGAAKFVRYAFALWFPYYADGMAHPPRTSLFDSGHLAGCLLAGAAADVAGAPVAIAAAAFAAMAATLRALPASVGASGGGAALALVGALAGATETLQGAVATLAHAQPGAEAAAAALVSGLGSLGALAAAPALPALAARYGWGGAFAALGAAAAAAAALAAALAVQQARTQPRTRRAIKAQ